MKLTLSNLKNLQINTKPSDQAFFKKLKVIHTKVCSLVECRRSYPYGILRRHKRKIYDGSS